MLALIYFSTESEDSFNDLSLFLKDYKFILGLIVLSFCILWYHILTGVRHLIKVFCNIYYFPMDYYYFFCILENLFMKGSTIWYLQRTSAIINLIYIVYVFYFICSTELTFEAWSNFFYSSIMIFLTLCFFASVIIHSFIGLWTVGTDYLTRRTIGFLSYRISKYADTFRSIYTVVFSIFGLSYLIVSLTIIFNNFS